MAEANRFRLDAGVEYPPAWKGSIAPIFPQAPPYFSAGRLADGPQMPTITLRNSRIWRTSVRLDPVAEAILITMRTNSIRNLLKKERGSNLVEFTLIITVLLLLIMGTIEFGRVMNAQILVTNSAREGARLGAVGGSAASIETKIENMIGNLSAGNLTVTVTNAQGTPGTQVTVDVQYDLLLVVPLISNIFPQNPVPLSSLVSMRLEA